jgi:hypothetical protein
MESVFKEIYIRIEDSAIRQRKLKIEGTLFITIGDFLDNGLDLIIAQNVYEELEELTKKGQ